MADPISLVIGGWALGGLIGNATDRAFCKNMRKVQRALLDARSAPANHDVERAARRSQLLAVKLALHAYERLEHPRFYDPKGYLPSDIVLPLTAWANEGLWKGATKPASAPQFEDVQALIDGAFVSPRTKRRKRKDGEATPEVEPDASERLVRLRTLAEDWTLSEVEGLVKQKMDWPRFANLIRNGSSDEKNPYLGWWPLFRAFFAEEVKSDPAVNAILTQQGIANMLDLQTDLSEAVNALAVGQGQGFEKLRASLTELRAICAAQEQRLHDITACARRVETETAEIAPVLQEIMGGVREIQGAIKRVGYDLTESKELLKAIVENTAPAHGALPKGGEALREAHEALRAKFVRTYRAAMGDRAKAMGLFHQALTPLSTDIVTIKRERLYRSMEEGLRKALEKRQLAVLLGEEGVGKTWAFAQYWLDEAPKDVFLFVSARAVDERMNAMNALDEAVKRVAPEHFANGVAYSVIDAAKQAGARAFILVDGLNENINLDWGHWLTEFEALYERGAQPIVSCRPRAWNENFADRFPDVVRIRIDEFDKEELRTFLTQSGVSPGDIPADAADGLSNPRYCQLAIELGKREGFAGLTKDRVLWNYWRRRLGENRSIALNDGEFQDLLSEHAKQVREAYKEQATHIESPRFDVRAIAASAVGETERRKLERDLSEIVEGRFFAPMERDGRYYKFRPDAMLFAIGLGLVQELDHREADDYRPLAERIADLLDPVRALDKAGRLVVSAIAVAAMKQRTELVSELIKAFLALQNRDQALTEIFCAYVNDCFEGYARAAESWTTTETIDEWLVLAFRAALGSQNIAPRVYQSASAWLGNQSVLSGIAAVRDDGQGEEPVGLLSQFAANVLAGFSLQPLDPSLDARLEKIQAWTPDAELLTWLGWLNRTPNEAFPPREDLLTSGTDTTGAANEAADEDDVLSFCLSRFSHLSPDAVIEGLAGLPTQLGSPFTHSAVARHLEASLTHLPIERRLEALRRCKLPDKTMGQNDGWPVRTAWRPALRQEDPSTWIVEAPDEAALRAAGLYLADQEEFSLDAAAQQRIAQVLVSRDPSAEFTEDMHAAVGLVLAARAQEAAAAFLETEWSVFGERDSQHRADGSRALAVACIEPGAYARARTKMAASVLPTALEMAPAGEFALIVDDLVNAVSAMTKVAAGDADVAVTAGGRRGRAFALEELQPLTKLDGLSERSAEAIARQMPDAFGKILDLLIAYAETEGGTTAPDGFAYAMLPVASREDAERGMRLAKALWRRDVARRGVTRARGRSGRLWESASYLGMASSDLSDRLVKEVIAGCADDGAISKLAAAARDLDRVEAMKLQCRAIMEEGALSDRHRAALIGAMLGADIPDRLMRGAPYAVSHHLKEIHAAYARTHAALSAWRVEEDSERRLVHERTIFTYAPLVIADASCLDLLNEREALMAARLVERSYGARSTQTLFGYKTPPAWLVTLNLRTL